MTTNDMLLDAINTVRDEVVYERKERVANGERITVLETEAGYVRKAVIGVAAMMAIPFGMACKAIAAWCALPRV
jgi:hypothetical protein